MILGYSNKQLVLVVKAAILPHTPTHTHPPHPTPIPPPHPTPIPPPPNPQPTPQPTHHHHPPPPPSRCNFGVFCARVLSGHPSNCPENSVFLKNFPGWHANTPGLISIHPVFCTRTISTMISMLFTYDNELMDNDQIAYSYLYDSYYSSQHQHYQLPIHTIFMTPPQVLFRPQRIKGGMRFGTFKCIDFKKSWYTKVPIF